jgi:hypothetical protein
MTAVPSCGTCSTCAHFRNDPRYLEAAFPGWSALGSAYGSTRAEDGICELRGIYLSARGSCGQHVRRRGCGSSTER